MDQDSKRTESVLSRSLGGFVFDEPWADLPSLRELGVIRKNDSVARNQIGRQTQKALFYRNAFDFLSCNGVTGDYFEFGCHRVRTFRMALLEAYLQQMTNMRFYAFDSFNGLPDASNPGNSAWQAGSLVTTESEFLGILKKFGADMKKVKTVPGFYQDSLNDVLASQLVSENAQIAFCCIDCDLYESSKSVFNFIDPFVQEGTVLYLDDFSAGFKGAINQGVAKAFREYEENSHWVFEEFLRVGWWGRSYIAHR